MDPLVDHEKRIHELEVAVRGLGTSRGGARVVDWSPLIRQNGTGITATVTDSFFVVAGKLVFLSCRLSLTANSATTGQIEVYNLPLLTSFDRSFSGGTFTYYDTSSALHYVGVVRGSSAGNYLFFTVSGNANNLGTTPSFTLGTGDGFSLFGVFPAEAIVI